VQIPHQVSDGSFLDLSRAIVRLGLADACRNLVAAVFGQPSVKNLHKVRLLVAGQRFDNIQRFLKLGLLCRHRRLFPFLFVPFPPAAIRTQDTKIRSKVKGERELDSLKKDFTAEDAENAEEKNPRPSLVHK
jgi:hypothetical protein